MSESHKAKIDLITQRPVDGKIVLVLVEEGPWNEDVTAELQRLQDRLGDCVDVAVDGYLAEKLPDSRGKGVIIRLDCYDTPNSEVKEFFERYAHHVEQSAVVQRDIQQKGNIRSLEFEYNRRPLQKSG